LWLRGASRDKTVPPWRAADLGFRPVLDSPKEKK